MRVVVAPFRLSVLLLSLAACSKTAPTQPKTNAAADAATIGADALVALALPEVSASAADGMHIVLPEVKVRRWHLTATTKSSTSRCPSGGSALALARRISMAYQWIETGMLQSIVQ